MSRSDCELGHSLGSSSDNALAERSVRRKFFSMSSVMAICYLSISRQRIACEARAVDGRL